MPETTPLIKAALNLRVGAGFDVYKIFSFFNRLFIKNPRTSSLNLNAEMRGFILFIIFITKSGRTQTVHLLDLLS